MRVLHHLVRSHDRRYRRDVRNRRDSGCKAMLPSSSPPFMGSHTFPTRSSSPYLMDPLSPDAHSPASYHPGRHSPVSNRLLRVRKVTGVRGCGGTPSARESDRRAPLETKAEPAGIAGDDVRALYQHLRHEWVVRVARHFDRRPSISSDSNRVVPTPRPKAR